MDSYHMKAELVNLPSCGRAASGQGLMPSHENRSPYGHSTEASVIVELG